MFQLQAEVLTNRALSPVKTTLITPNELDTGLVALWRQWQLASGHSLNPFLSPTFATTYGRHQKKSRIAVVEDGSEVVGLVPIELTSIGVARSLAYGLSDVQAPAFKPGYEFNTHRFISSCGIAVFEFDRFVPEIAKGLKPASVRLVPSPVIDLTAGYEEWLARKRKASSSTFRRVLQKQRKIGRDLGEVEFTYASTSHADLELLMAWKSAQYIRTGRRDLFARPWFRNVLHDLLEQGNDEFRLVLSKLSAGGRTLALDAGLRNEHTVAGWFPAYDPEFSKYSPGSVCLLMQIEGTANSGLTRMDLGVGEADYKESFKDFDDQVAEGWCARRDPRTFLRRASKMPRELAVDFVLERPQLRLAARRTLNLIGSVRHRAIKQKSVDNTKAAGFLSGVPAVMWEVPTSFPVVPFL